MPPYFFHTNFPVEMASVAGMEGRLLSRVEGLSILSSYYPDRLCMFLDYG